MNSEEINSKAAQTTEISMKIARECSRLIDEFGEDDREKCATAFGVSHYLIAKALAMLEERLMEPTLEKFVEHVLMLARAAKEQERS